MLLVKANGSGEKTKHCFPQKMRGNDKLGVNLGTHSLHRTCIHPIHLSLLLSLTTVQEHTNLARPCKHAINTDCIGLKNKQIYPADVFLLLWVSPFPTHHKY